jgi:hypothetical protein
MDKKARKNPRQPSEQNDPGDFREAHFELLILSSRSWDFVVTLGLIDNSPHAFEET